MLPDSLDLFRHSSNRLSVFLNALSLECNGKNQCLVYKNLRVCVGKKVPFYFRQPFFSGLVLALNGICLCFPYKLLSKIYFLFFFDTICHFEKRFPYCHIYFLSNVSEFLRNFFNAVAFSRRGIWGGTGNFLRVRVPMKRV